MKHYGKEFYWVLLTAWVICLPIAFVDSAYAPPLWYRIMKLLGGASIPAGIGFIFLIARHNRAERRLKTAITITVVVSLFVCYSTIRLLTGISERTGENPYNAVVEQAIKEGTIKASPDGRAILTRKGRRMMEWNGLKP